MRITTSLRDTQKMFDAAEDMAQQLVRDGYEFFVKQTPVRTGNARKNTRLNGTTIDANYAYAQPLDQGRSSQSPKGMTEPTEKYLEQRLEQLTRKVNNG
jgi:hypothetical protein